MSGPIGQTEATLTALERLPAALELAWQMRLATVVEGGTPGDIRLRLDGDTASDPVHGFSTLGRLAAGSRVYVVSVPPAGVYAIGYAGFTVPGVVARRGRRITSTVASGAETGVLRIDNIPIKAGWLYWAGSGPVLLDVSAAGDHCKLELRYATGGAVATTASTSLTQAQIDIADAANGDSVSVGAFLPVQVADTFLSLILTHDVTTGAGTVFAFASATVPIDLFVTCCGPDPGDDGVVL